MDMEAALPVVWQTELQFGLLPETHTAVQCKQVETELQFGLRPSKLKLKLQFN